MYKFLRTDGICKGKSDETIFKGFSKYEGMFLPIELDTAKEIIAELREIYDSTELSVTFSKVGLRGLLGAVELLKQKIRLRYQVYFTEKVLNSK